MILDFEGEPGRPLLDRRRKRSPLRDVAGMVRSLAYAAWRRRCCAAPRCRRIGSRTPRRFIDGYMATADPAILPAGGPALEKLLAIFELERAIYELRYGSTTAPIGSASPSPASRACSGSRRRDRRSGGRWPPCR